MSNAIPTSGTVYWLDEAMAGIDEQACPPLAGHINADICIVGGGYLGLWTAIEILERSPDASVVLLEAEGCGFGASGRNGGWMTGWHDGLDAIIAEYGLTDALWLAERSAWAIDRVADFSKEYGIDCRLRRYGATKVAVTPVQVGKWKSAMQACRDHGRGDFYAEVGAEEVRRRTGSPLPLQGAVQTDGATIQPAMLARGLRRAALQLGVQIFEGTPMIGLNRGTPPQVQTMGGAVTANQVVLATGAWIAGLPELRRAVVPVGSSIVATEPLGDRLLGREFARGDAFGDQRLSVHYMQVTTDGRLIFGRGGGKIGRAGRIHPSLLHDAPAWSSIVEDLHRWFPDLSDARITHAWTGPVDRAQSPLPFVGSFGDNGNIHYAGGFSGNGVAPAAYLGRVLGKVALGIDDEDARSPLMGGPRAYLPPEPFRYLGGTLVRASVEYVEEMQDNGHLLNGRINKTLRKLIGVTTPRHLEPRLRKPTADKAKGNARV